MQPIKDVVYKYSAGGVVIKEGKVLVISSKLRNSIGLPKGQIDQGESVEQAAVREVKEETGYDVTIIEKLNDYTFEFDWTDGSHRVKTVTFFLMELANDLPPVPDLQPGEDFEVQWLKIDEALAVFTYQETSEALRLAVHKLAEQS